MNTRTAQPIMIAPELRREESDLVLTLRTLKSGIAEVTVADGLPSYVTIRFPDCVNRQEIGIYPLTFDEREVLRMLRFIRFGRLVVNITETGKYTIMADTEQRFKMGSVDWAEWL